MSGFSRQTVRYGINHFLAKIHRLHTIALPFVEHHGGEILLTEPARKRLRAAGQGGCEEIEMTVAGLNLTAHRHKRAGAAG